ncbi:MULTISPECIES: PucR family transcriptional regulator [Streptomyces]|uniref:Carbohydrate diacid transcriptional activator CdaR n=2 Tax=Streptomyces TaxID=1883 RepID=A0AAE6TSR5_STRPT|nr:MULTISPECIES: PucR family transcriptional regulator ligand-binding domain-containing protein [Streptomyces]MCF3145100.1 PucR family transcriptional regulator ligand-binding domain-containing protein [Streptomyces platensis]OSY46632.1 carbohydrate diacid transcriptional activator CdaR [Streptomyces platensis]QEV55398.1 PucR family transcriptional regulator [Streptomyces platensis]WSW55309.1 PucR family transcriptional regulator ligand-binding domain-containing protein [Streptomyces platensis]
MRLRALLDTPSLGLRLLGGEDELDRTVRGVMTTDLRDPSRYLSGGELVLTGLAWRRAPEDSERFVRILAAAGVAGLAAGEAELGSVPDDLVAACVQHRLPLFSVVEDVSFASITEHVVRQVSSERAGDLAAVVDRHRRLMTSGPTGGGPEVVLDLLGSDLDLRAWVLSPTGRQIAGSTLAGAGPELSTELAARLAGEHLAAARSGRRGPHRVTLEGAGGTFSLFPIRHDGRDLRQTLLSDWLLAVEADAGDWPEERLDLLHGVTQLIAVERDRRDAARTVRRRLAQEVLELVQTGAPPAEIAARLRVAAPVLLPGLGTAPHWQIVVARVEWEDGDVPGGPVAQSLLEEVLVDPGTFGPEPSDRIAVAHTGDEAVALVPLPVPDEPGDSSAAGLHAAELLSVVQAPLGRGLADDGRLTVGVSASVHSAEGLRGALEEARHARRVAAARPGRVCAAGHEELASHVLLLPFVPDDVRRAFTARLLDPLRDYDRRHRAELIPTLEAFLDCDGSWTRCAGRLHLHVNTLRYRVGRIEQLTGRDLSRLEDKLDFFLALRMS